MSTKSSLLLEPSLEVAECLDRITAEKSVRQPFSTYRLQFNKDFRFEAARRLVPYLHRIGITHCYASPILKAREGSSHGYDIVDHTQLNPEIGTEEEFRALVGELKSHGMGLVLDMVPNHMGTGHGTNPWWQNVLQNGRASRYTDYFDIDWEPLKPQLRNKVLIPVLGNQYGEELEMGNIQVRFSEGQFSVVGSDRVFPIDPQTIPLIFEPLGSLASRQSSPEVDKLVQLLGELRLLPLNEVTDGKRIARRRQEAPAMLQRLRTLASDSEAVRSLISETLQLLNGKPGDAHSFDALHRLLEAQVYRLAFWRVSAEEVNYRRFFDINELIGLRMENPLVFADTHKLIRKFMGDGLIDGLRIDHPDGLLNPAQYFSRVQRLYVASRCCGVDPQPPLAESGIELAVQNALGPQIGTNHKAPLYVLVEKILEPGEDLPSDWPVDGTVGYDFTNLVNGILIDHRHERYFTNLYHSVIDDSVDVDQLIYNSKKLIMNTSLSSEVNVLTHMLDEISSQDRCARDFTRSVLQDAICETIACFPVYRTYIDESGKVQEWDRRNIQQAIDRAKRRNSNMPSAVFDFLRSILLLEGNSDGRLMFDDRKQLYFSLKFQQLTGPVMAKGLEDTACYVYTRFVSVNEVGGSPAEFGVPLGEFHRANQIRGERWPYSMLATSTHDTKRSEDLRARLDVLSEIGRTWGAHVMKWRRINRTRKIKLSDGRVVPDNNEEYLLYQTLIGAWPLRAGKLDTERLDFIGRIQRYMEKALHEAKVNLSWVNQNPEYVDALNSFIERIVSPMHGGRTNLFWESLHKLVPAVAYFGVINSLTQTLLKLTAPGVPDIYQGQELLDFSLVDPDNRRPVDFELRQRHVRELDASWSSGDTAGFCHELLRRWHDGRMKLWVTLRTLNYRNENKDLFQHGRYVPLQVLHDKEEHVVAFARVQGQNTAIVAAPRLSYTLMKGKVEPPTGHVWSDMELVLPAEVAGRQWRNVFTGKVLRSTARNSLLCREVFTQFPVALLGVI